MVTNVPGNTAREPNHALVGFISARLAFATFISGSQLKIGTIPAGSRILRLETVVGVVFNNATNNGLSVGTAAGGAQISAADTTSVGALGTNSKTLVASAAMFVTADTDIWVNANFSGAAATTGLADVILEYVVTHGGQDAF